MSQDPEVRCTETQPFADAAQCVASLQQVHVDRAAYLFQRSRVGGHQRGRVLSVLGCCSFTVLHMAQLQRVQLLLTLLLQLCTMVSK